MHLSDYTVYERSIVITSLFRSCLGYEDNISIMSIDCISNSEKQCLFVDLNITVFVKVYKDNAEYGQFKDNYITYCTLNVASLDHFGINGIETAHLTATH